MAVKIVIKRKVPENKLKEMVPLFKEMRVQATRQPGYISGETMRNLSNPDEFIVISTWQSSKDWQSWAQSKERNRVQDRIDKLLGGKTNFDIYHYGLKE